MMVQRRARTLFGGVADRWVTGRVIDVEYNATGVRLLWFKGWDRAAPTV